MYIGMCIQTSVHMKLCEKYEHIGCDICTYTLHKLPREVITFVKQLRKWGEDL